MKTVLAIWEAGKEAKVQDFARMFIERAVSRPSTSAREEHGKSKDGIIGFIEQLRPSMVDYNKEGEKF
jgi:hypothetical protein